MDKSGPLYVALDLGALPTAPGCARAWTREILREWQLARLSDTAELIVSDSLNLSICYLGPFFAC
jgi:hypothetical protein